VRKLPGIKSRLKSPVLVMPFEKITGRHSMICRRLADDLWPTVFNLRGDSPCEIALEDFLAHTGSPLRTLNLI